MPITVPTLQTRLQQNLSARQIGGAKSKDLSLGIANGFVNFLPSMKVQTVDFGVIGSGTSVQGTIQLEPATGTTILQGTLSAVGISGAKSKDLASSVSVAFTNAMLQDAQVNTLVTGVSNGSGTGTFLPINAPTLIGSLLSAFQAVGMNGTKTSDLAAGLGNGLASFLQTATIVTVDSGSPVPFGNPSSGTGFGTVS